jgi:hypothetical protein
LLSESEAMATLDTLRQIGELDLEDGEAA